MAAWLGIMAAGVLASFGAPDDPANAPHVCRSYCGEAWINAQACPNNADAVRPVSPIQCRKRADRAYQACLDACGPAPGLPEPLTKPGAGAKAKGEAKSAAKSAAN